MECEVRGGVRMIDEELWKKCHLELIHKEIKSEWRRHNQERYFKKLQIIMLRMAQAQEDKHREKYKNKRLGNFRLWLSGY